MKELKLAKLFQPVFYVLMLCVTLGLVCACGDEEDDPIQEPDTEQDSATSGSGDDGGSGSTPSAPVKNTTDRAVSDSVVECGCTYASICGYANLNLLPDGYEDASIKIELRLAGDDTSSALYGSTNYVGSDSVVVRFSNLSPATKYEYRTYVSYGAYMNGNYLTFRDNGAWLTFTTRSVPNVTTTGEVTGVTYRSATVSAGLKQDEVDLRDNLRFGVAWSASKADLQNDNLVNVNKGYSQSVVDGVYSVSLSGLSLETTYYYAAFAEVNGKYCMAGVKSFTTEEPHYEWVDLGLPSGLKWATCNVGASSPEEYGDYFAWGETTTKSSYTSSNSTTYNLSVPTLHFHRGIIGSDGNLTAAYDAATANWGGSWRMPTFDEMEELLNKCTWTWTTQNGVKGRKVTGPNGNSIFLPAAGHWDGTDLLNAGSHGYYWSATIYSYGGGACSLYFNSDYYYSIYHYHYYGRSVRPVSDELLSDSEK